MQTVHVVFNPASGSFSPGRSALILSLLRAAGLDPRPLLPQSPAEAHQSIAELCSRPSSPPVIIAVGGDGTVNTVINSIPRNGATLGIIPLGTANVMARELGISSLHDAVSRITRGTVRPFAVGEASSAWGSRRFALMAGVGFDAAAVADVRPAEKRLLGKGAYLLAGLRRCRSWDHRPLTVASGSRTLICDSLIIANAAHYAGPYRLAPGADLFSPQLEVVALPFDGPISLLRFAASLFLRGRYASSDAFSSEPDPISISGAKPVQLDGDPFGTAPLTIRVLPNFNHLIV